MKIDEMLKIIQDIDSDKMNLYMVHRIKSKRKNSKGYSILNPTIQSEFKKQLKTIVIDELNYYKELTPIAYNPVGSLADNVEYAKISDFPSISLLQVALENPVEKYNFSNSNFACFIYEFPYVSKKGETSSLLVFRRTNKFKKFKKGFMGYLVDGSFKKLSNKDILATDNNIDFIMDDKIAYIFQHISFERIFNLRNEFRDKAIEVLKNKKLSEKIENFDKLKDIALDDQSYVKRLAKLSDSNNDPTLFLSNLEDTKKVIEDFHLDIEIDKNNDKLIFKNESQVSSIIGLMQDAYYKTLIGKSIGMDKRR